MDVLQLAVAVAFMLLGLTAVRLWWRNRSPTTAWLAWTLGALGAALFTGRLAPLLPDDVGATLARLQRVLLVAFPYLLFRFTASFQPVSRRILAAAGVLAGAVLAVTVVVSAPATEGPPPTWYLLYVAGVLVMWTLLSSWVVWRLWRSSRSQSNVARLRLRTLALAVAMLNLALVLAGLSVPEAPPALTTTIQAGALISALLFYAAFAPPALLRQAWRRKDEQALWRAEGDLMAAVTSREIAASMLPHVSRMLGDRPVLLQDESGEEFSHGTIPDALRARLMARDEPGPGAVTKTDDLVILELRGGRLGVMVTPVTPLFGRDELELLGRLGTMMNLALTRSEAFDREKAARAQAEESAAELEALVYGLSHDLRRPIVSVLGYADCLAEDYGPVLEGDGAHFLARLRRNVEHMDELIGDLLQLSRVGKVDEEPQPVDLTAVVRHASEELARQHPEATLEVGVLPTVMMNPTRAHQLFANLLSNALVHSGRPDVTVRVSPAGTPGGVTVADNGRGIPTADREKVFGLFQRLNATGTGTGIGLAMCRRIVEHAAGRIWITDSDEGTHVRVELPPVTPDSAHPREVA
ncbi:MAG: HAMP domain-containing sensor histidine kinase [Egibacteraceae bacterium]